MASNNTPVRVLTIESELKSARHLRWPTATNFDQHISKHKKETVFIRWGNSHELYDDQSRLCEFPKIINSGNAIHANCNKNKAGAKLAKVVKTPQVFVTRVPAEKTAVLRYCQHSAGSDFKVVQGPCEIEEGFYAREFIKTKKEFRVWFCNGATYRARRVPMKDQEETEFPCRSDWGYRFIGYDKVPRKLHWDTLRAAKAIGLESGAADVLESNGEFLFLELNSAPSIDHWRIENFFRLHLTQLINGKYGLSLPIPALDQYHY